MKVYLFYLTLPLDFEDENGAITACTKELISSFHCNRNLISYLFAFTSKKKRAELFEKMYDMSIFTKIVREMSDGEYQEFEAFNDKILLDSYPFDFFLPSSITDDEKIFCTQNLLETFSNMVEGEFESMMAQATFIPYYQYKSKYIEALDLLYYTWYHAMNGPDYEYYQYNYNMDYGMTLEGYKKVGASAHLDVVSMWVKYFRIILAKGT
jgi:hypothetical protein